MHLSSYHHRLACALTVLATATGFARAEDPEPLTRGQTVEPVFEAALPNAPGNELTAIVVDYAPGGRTESHRHAGSVFAYVLSGAIRSRLDDGPARVYRAGETFFEPPGTLHSLSENASATEPARLLAVFVAAPGAALVTPAR